MKVVEHTADERLHCGAYCDYANFSEFYENGEIYILHGKSMNDCEDFGENDLICE